MSTTPYRLTAAIPTIEYRLNDDFVASDVTRWYHKVPLDARAVIAIPGHPCVRLYRRPNEQVYWCADGSRGLTVPLHEAQQRLAMFQTHWRVDT